MTFHTTTLGPGDVGSRESGPMGPNFTFSRVSRNTYAGHDLEVELTLWGPIWRITGLQPQGDEKELGT